MYENKWSNKWSISGQSRFSAFFDHVIILVFQVNLWGCFTDSDEALQPAGAKIRSLFSSPKNAKNRYF
jgi:hypothetical protein